MIERKSVLMSNRGRTPASWLSRSSSRLFSFAQRTTPSHRNHEPVRYRFTREGFNFLLILLFVLIAAILRNVSLLIILAGVMTGLMLLQWRIAYRTLLGLNVTRRLPTSMPAGQEVDVLVEVHNPRRWLGSWLIVVEDRLARVLPAKEVSTKLGTVLIDEVQPGDTRRSSYTLKFNHRGQYRIGGSTISTRFPLSLGVAIRERKLFQDIMIHPRLGQISPRCRELLEMERQGLSQATPRAGVNEGEFYGLRQWHNGDSQRWIHWRTTARLGELAVRQFEQQQRLHISLLVDLYRPPKKDRDAEHAKRIERIVAFAATLATDLVGKGRHKLGVAIAGKELFTSPSVQSRILVGHLLDQLAIAQEADTDRIELALQSLYTCLMRNPVLLVISTRPNQIESIRQHISDAVGQRLISRLQVRWLNVTQGDLEPFFQWTDAA